jgi:hypothetical protein
MFVVSLDQHVWIHTTPNLAAARRIQKRIQRRGFWIKRDQSLLTCSYKKFAGAKHFAEFFGEDIIIQYEEN